MENKTVEEIIEKINKAAFEHQDRTGFHTFFDFLSEDLEAISLQCAELQKLVAEIQGANHILEKTRVDLQSENESLKKLLDEKQKRIEELQFALNHALPYVRSAYECAFPDEQENQYVTDLCLTALNQK